MSITMPQCGYIVVSFLISSVDNYFIFVYNNILKFGFVVILRYRQRNDNTFLLYLIEKLERMHNGFDEFIPRARLVNLLCTI